MKTEVMLKSGLTNDSGSVLDKAEEVVVYMSLQT